MPLLQEVFRPPEGSAICSELQMHLKTCTNGIQDSCVQVSPPLLGCVHDLAGWGMVNSLKICLFPKAPTKKCFCISTSGKELLNSEMNMYLSMNGDTKVHYRCDLALRIKQILDITLRDGTGRQVGLFVLESRDLGLSFCFAVY